MSAAESTHLPIAALFARALDASARASELPTIDNATQELVQSARTDLRNLASRVDALALFSPNETLEDLTARDMVYLLVPYVRAEVESRVRTTDPSERLDRLREAFSLLIRFNTSLEQYEIVTEDDRALWKASGIADPTRRRETKIKQYKSEKAIRGAIDALRASRNQPPVDGTAEFDDVIALLPSEKAEQAGDDGDDDDVRKVTILVLRLLWSKAQGKLDSMRQEVEILASMPPPGPSSSAPHNTSEEDTSWRLDTTPGTSARGPLLDSKGKPLRPFTILPAGTHRTREEVAAGVFRPDHRLPTMTIDEYLAEEQERGNIITGGGPASLEQPTTSEQLGMDAEQDGTLFGDEKTEAKRQKDEDWARYTDVHRKGEGNTMNRG